MSDQNMQECFEFYYDLKWEQVNDFAQQAWKAAWEASRESLVVELPKPIEAYGSQGHHASDPDEALILEDVHAALTAAGVKYK